MDIITYIPNLDLFRAECQALAEAGNKFFSYDGETLTYNISQIPVVYMPDYTQSLCLVRLLKEDEQETFDALTTIDRLGVCDNKEYIFNSDDDKATYEDARGALEYTYTYEDGNEQTAYKPYMIGVFA